MDRAALGCRATACHTWSCGSKQEMRRGTQLSPQIRPLNVSEPIGSIVVPFCSSYLGSYTLNPKTLDPEP